MTVAGDRLRRDTKVTWQLFKQSGRSWPRRCGHLQGEQQQLSLLGNPELAGPSRKLEIAKVCIAQRRFDFRILSQVIHSQSW